MTHAVVVIIIIIVILIINRVKQGQRFLVGFNWGCFIEVSKVRAPLSITPLGSAQPRWYVVDSQPSFGGWVLPWLTDRSWDDRRHQSLSQRSICRHCRSFCRGEDGRMMNNLINQGLKHLRGGWLFGCPTQMCWKWASMPTSNSVAKIQPCQHPPSCLYSSTLLTHRVDLTGALIASFGQN